MPFSTEAVNITNARMRDYKNKVGSVLKKESLAKYKDYQSTDCITFGLHVLRDTFIKMGHKDVAGKLVSYGSATR